MTDQHAPDDFRDAVTTPAPPPDRESPTSPDASTGPILPPAPRTLEDSYLDQAIRVVASAGARMDEDRAERQNQHNEVMDALLAQGARQDAALDRVAGDMARIALELNANLELLSEQFRRHRAASDARLAEGDRRFAEIERTVQGIKKDLLDELPEAMHAILAPYLVRIEALEAELLELRPNGTARPPTAPTG